jgi:purple acid phosphatase-like protein/calcineurin-like phosphoesterase family protein
MHDFTRRRFLQTASLLAAGGYGHSVLVKRSQAAEDAAAPPAAVPAFAEKPTFDPSALFLTWQRDPTTTMTVQWVGEEKDAATRPIWFAKEGSKEWKNQTWSSRKFPLTDRTIFRTELTRLEPGTDYRFRVGNDSAEQRFRTMPAKANDTIHFVSGGDSGIGAHAVKTNHVAAAQSPMFVVIAGDIAYENGKSPAIFYQFLKNYSRDLRDDKQRLIPLLGCMGNHEAVGGYGKTRKEAPFFYSVFDGLFPETGYASLDFGDYLSLIFLDTGHTSPIEGAQTDWLARTLKEREECPTVFAFNHVPAYPSYRPFSSSDDAEGGTGAGNRKHWVPLFERYNVDAVFEHHDHTYKRTHPLLGGRPNDNGIIYLGDGSWGQLRAPKTPEERPYLAMTHKAYHSSVHRIEGRERFHMALSDVGQVVDVCVTKKRSHRRTT